MTAVDVRTPVAAATATLLGALALSPVLSSGAWVRPVVDVVLVVLLTGLALRGARAVLADRVLRGRPGPRLVAGLGTLLVPLGQLAALTVVLTRRATDVGGLLPSARGIEALGEVLRAGAGEIREQVAPATPVPELAALIALFVGLAAVLVDLVAVEGRQAALGGAVLLLLAGVPVFTLDGEVGPVTVLGPAAGFAVLLWADQSRRLDARGRPRARRTAGTGSAVRIGLVAAVVAVLGGGLLPTLAEGTLRGGSGGSGGTGTALDPVAEMVGQLTRNEPVSLLRLETEVEDPGYLRAVTVDRYDAGTGWTESGAGAPVTLDDALRTEHDPAEGREVSARIEATGHDDRFLPLPVSPVQVQLEGGADGWRYDSITGTVSASDATSEDRVWEVTASEVRPTPEQLAAAPPLADGELEGRFFGAPGLDPSVQALVDTLTAGAENGYARVRRILDFLTDARNGFTYSLSTSPGTSGDDLVDFLEERRGYCEQYAGAMAAMVRAAGLPSRVALGYTPGDPVEDGSRLVTSDDAHAWVEVFFAGFGWVPFDPTPIDESRRSELPWAPRVEVEDAPEQAVEQQPELAPEDLSFLDPLGPLGPDPGAFDAAPADTPAEGRSWPARTGLVLLVVAAAAAPGGLRLLQRRRRLALGTARALWDELSATADDLGLGRDPAWTPRETGRALAGRTGGPGGGAAIDRLARAEERASYGPAAEGHEDGLVADLRTARRALRGTVDRRTRLRAACWPASLPAAVRAGLPAWTRPEMRRSRRPGGRRLRAGRAEG
ncbi:transglutaminase family protein [Blastococcus sp. SYSU D01042]